MASIPIGALLPPASPAQPVIAAVLLLALAGPAHAQIVGTRHEIIAGAPVHREIRGDEVHRVGLELSAGEFAYVAAVEKDIDVSVKLISPSGRLIGWYDGGDNGLWFDPLSPVTVFAQESGIYWMDIHPMQRGSSGRYTLVLERREPAAESAAGRARQWLSAWSRAGEPGVAAGVSIAGETVFADGFGEASVEHGVPITPRTVFHVASVTKPVIAFATHLLVERGQLVLDEPVHTYLPWLPAAAVDINLRHLLHHTSGLPEPYFRLSLADWDGHDLIRQDHVLDLLRGEDSLYFSPGAEYMYTNIAYELLVETIEAVTGETIQAWAAAHIFEPLGMTDTFLRGDVHQLIPNGAGSYFMDSGRRVVLEPDRSTVLLGGMGLHTTVEDLLKWSRNLATGAVGGPAVRERMREAGVLNDGTVLPYASGLEIDGVAGRPVLLHGGRFMGTRSLFALWPEHDLAVVVLSNRGEFDVGRTTFRLGELFLGDTVAGNLNYAETIRYSAPAGAADPAAGEQNPGRLDAYVGRYAVTDAEFEVYRAGDRLWLHEVGADHTTVLRLTGDTAQLVSPAAPVELLFERNAAGDVVAYVELVDGEHADRARRVEPYRPTAVDLREYEGSFRSEALQSIWSFTVQGDSLVAHHRRHGDVPLRAISRDRFGGPGFLRDVEFVRDAHGGIIAMTVSRPRIRGERFERLVMDG
jgi:CubicO group peptidase (beta-lactamase class C family)